MFALLLSLFTLSLYGYLSAGIFFPTILAFLFFFFLEDLGASINYRVEGILEARVLLISLLSLLRPKESGLVASVLLCSELDQEIAVSSTSSPN